MRKATGMVRRMDPLGRIVLPIEMRRTLQIKEDDPMEIFTEEDGIFIRKYRPGCFFCGKADNLEEIGGIQICPDCAGRMAEIHAEKRRGHDCA